MHLGGRTYEKAGKRYELAINGEKSLDGKGESTMKKNAIHLHFHFLDFFSQKWCDSRRCYIDSEYHFLQGPTETP